MGLLSFLFGNKPNPIKEILEQGATIIDVRTAGEFNSGHVDGAINIPLNQIEHKVGKIKKMKSPYVLCCASGARSASATSMLKSADIKDVYNGGSWFKVHRLMNN